MNHAKKFLLPLLVLTAAIGLVACGGGDGSSDEETVAGAFEALPGAPPAYSKVSGDAELSRSDGGTAAEIQLGGLEPSTAYVAHLHTGGCDQPDAGGPHFQFEKGGSEAPPNEIHFEFESNAKGEGSAKATSDQEVPSGEAGSIVLHLADDHSTAMAGNHAELAAMFVHEGEHHDEGDDHGEDHAGDDHGDEGDEHSHSDKIACAELEGGGSAGAAVPTIVVRDGEPVGGIEQLEYSAGEQIRFKVSGDEAEEIHVHGYDLMKDIPAGGGTVEFDFPAEIEGIFEAELEGQGVQILELTVNP